MTSDYAKTTQQPRAAPNVTKRPLFGRLLWLHPTPSSLPSEPFVFTSSSGEQQTAVDGLILRTSHWHSAPPSTLTFCRTGFLRFRRLGLVDGAFVVVAGAFFAGGFFAGGISKGG